MICKHCGDTLYRVRDLTAEIAMTQAHRLDHVLSHFDDVGKPICWNCSRRFDYRWVRRDLWGQDIYRIANPGG
jgi:hypothetical protein